MTRGRSSHCCRNIFPPSIAGISPAFDRAQNSSCIETADRPLFDERTLSGLSDTVELIGEEAARLGTIRQRTEVITIKHLREEIEASRRLVSGPAPETLSPGPPFSIAQSAGRGH